MSPNISLCCVCLAILEVAVLGSAVPAISYSSYSSIERRVASGPPVVDSGMEVLTVLKESVVDDRGDNTEESCVELTVGV